MSSSSDIDFAPLGFYRQNPTAGRSIDVVKLLVTHWKPLVLGLGLGTALGVLAYISLGPAWLAYTRIKVSQKASLKESGAQLYSSRSTHDAMIKSDAVTNLAYTKFGLDKLPDFNTDNDPLKELSSGLIVTRISGQENAQDNIFSISFQHPKKEVAKEALQAIVEGYHEWLDQSRDKSSNDLQAGQEHNKEVLDTEIARLEKEYKEWWDGAPYHFKTPPVVQVNGVASVPPNAYEVEIDRIHQRKSNAIEEMNRIEKRLQSLQEMRANQESREHVEAYVKWALASGTGGGAGDGGGGGGTAADTLLNKSGDKNQLDQQLLIAKVKESHLVDAFGENHADVRKIRSEIQKLLAFYNIQGLIPPNIGGMNNSASPMTPGVNTPSRPNPNSGVDLADVYAHILKTQLDEAQGRDKQYDKDLIVAEKEAKKAADFEKQDQKFKDSIGLKRKEWEDVNKTLAGHMRSKAQEGYNLATIDEIRVEKSTKRFLKIVGAGAGFGLILVFALTYLAAWMDTTIRTLEEVRQTTRAPIMAAVPKFKPTAESNRHAQETGLSPALCYFHRPGSREAEAYRSIRTTLFHDTLESGQRIIQISSPEPGDGKTTSASNLAIAIAQSGKRVLLIDADLRRPTVNSLFNLPPAPGLSEVLAHLFPWREAVRESQIHGLSLMTAGELPENPAELLSDAKLPEFLKEARGEYDFVLVDTPPILAVSDPCIVSPYVDVMVLIVRLEKNRRPSVVRTREVLDAHGIRLLGVIANDQMVSEESGYGYDMYYETKRPTKPNVGQKILEKLHQ